MQIYVQICYTLGKNMTVNFLTVEEFASRVKLHPASVRRSIKKGKIFASRPTTGKKAPYRIAESELERLMLQGMCEGQK
jgi:excisionase family DNA binding protein